MAGRFLDSSAVAKFYHAEVGSAAVEQIVLDVTASIAAAPWKILWPPTRSCAKLPQPKECRSSILNFCPCK